MVQFKHKLARKEKFIISLAAMMLVIAVYYFGCYQPCQTMIASYNTEDLMQELTIEQVRRTQNKNMEKEIDANKAAGVGRVYPYNQLQMEVSSLNRIMSITNSFDIDFASPIQEGNTVRRNVAISFTAANYATAKAIIENLYTCEYRCLVNNVSLSATNAGWSGSVQAVFIETMKDATTEDGLIQSSKTTAATTSELAE